MNIDAITHLFEAARRDGRDMLLETEGLDLLGQLGLTAPAWVRVGGPGDITAELLAALPSPQVVVKVVSPRILHKSDVGGVAIVDASVERVAAVVSDMHARLSHLDIRGFTISECVDYPAALGHELIVGLRWTDDVGPVVTVGAGGIYTEFLARNFRSGRAVAVLSPELETAESVRAAVADIAVVQLVTRPMRGQPVRVALDGIVSVVQTFLTLADTAGTLIAECEVNPFVLTGDGRVVALDILLKLRDRLPPVTAAPRPIAKLECLLKPRSAAIIGVSERLNPGHIIVNNLIRGGFPRDRIFIVKPGSAVIEGCRCVPDIASLPERVDLCVLVIDAARASEALVEIVERRASESVVLIPGGLEEKAGSDTLVRRMHDALAEARRSDWGGPVINGGNCLGIRSLPGRYDTTFIPEYKRRVRSGAPSRLAIISQSGAFAVAKASKLSALNPTYVITLGNQMDLTAGDYLTYLKDDSGIDVFAVYMEGFRPLDGLRFLRAAREIVAQGRTVILYRAGRTPAGAKASASHTASIAGDYIVLRALAASAGVVVAETLEDFEDLTLLFTLLGPLTPAGWRLGAVSNAGFECVAMADNLGAFTLPPFSAATDARLRDIFVSSRIDQVVDVHNPIDLTPMMGDDPFARVVDAVLHDDAFDAAIVGCVPMTGALNTLPPGHDHTEDVGREDSLVTQLCAMRATSRKPWLAVVDAGPLYDEMERRLVSAGLPTFRSADRALRLFNVYCAARMSRTAG